MPELPFKLDEYDRRLLYELDKDSHQPLSSLAKRLRKSKQFVLFRQKRLEEAKVITHYTAIIDMAKLGYTSYRLYFKFAQMTEADKQKAIDYVKSLPGVWTVTAVHGKWDLAIFVGTKDMQGLHAVWDVILSRYKPHIERYNLSLYAPIYNFNRTFFMQKESDVITRTYGEGPVQPVDETSWRIIQAYAPDVRQSMVQLGHKLRLAPETVRKRIKLMEEKKIICGYKIGLDIARLGYTSYRLDFELTSTKRYKELFEYCRQHPAIYQVQNTIGHSDFETEAVVSDLSELLAIIDEVQTRFKDTVKDADYFGYSTYHLLNYIPD